MGNKRWPTFVSIWLCIVLTRYIFFRSPAKGSPGLLPWLGLFVTVVLIVIARGAWTPIREWFQSLKRKERPRPVPAYPCPACGFVVFKKPPGSGAVCAICGWTDDEIQLLRPMMGGGANHMSLLETQTAILKNLPAGVRERGRAWRDPRWRPLRDEDLFRAAGGDRPTYYWLRDGDG